MLIYLRSVLENNFSQGSGWRLSSVLNSLKSIAIIPWLHNKWIEQCSEVTENPPLNVCMVNGEYGVSQKFLYGYESNALSDVAAGHLVLQCFLQGCGPLHTPLYTLRRSKDVCPFFILTLGHRVRWEDSRVHNRDNWICWNLKMDFSKSEF